MASLPLSSMSSSSSLVVVLPAVGRKEFQIQGLSWDLDTCPPTHPQPDRLQRWKVRQGAWGDLGGEGWGVSRTDFQLPLDPVLAAVPILGLRCIIFSHYFHELPGEGGVLKEEKGMMSLVHPAPQHNNLSLLSVLSPSPARPGPPKALST